MNFKVGKEYKIKDRLMNDLGISTNTVKLIGLTSGSVIIKVEGDSIKLGIDLFSKYIVPENNVTFSSISASKRQEHKKEEPEEEESEEESKEEEEPKEEKSKEKSKEEPKEEKSKEKSKEEPKEEESKEEPKEEESKEKSKEEPREEDEEGNKFSVTPDGNEYDDENPYGDDSW